jgi:predicted  nucleic acid-binding Zn-ribbon protein
MNIEELRAKLQQLRKEHPSTTAILKAQEDAAKEIKQRMEEADRKRNEIHKVLDKKMKEWEMEYKVLSKYQATKVSNLPS